MEIFAEPIQVATVKSVMDNRAISASEIAELQKVEVSGEDIKAGTNGALDGTTFGSIFILGWIVYAIFL
jgi:hypothetical protein